MTDHAKCAIRLANAQYEAENAYALFEDERNLRERAERARDRLWEAIHEHKDGVLGLTQDEWEDEPHALMDGQLWAALDVDVR